MDSQNSNQQFFSIGVEHDDDVEITLESREVSTSHPSSKPPTARSDMFVKHISKICDTDGNPNSVICNYCKIVYAWKRGAGYGTLKKHMMKHHLTEFGVEKSQTQITGYTSSSSNQQIFKFSEQQYKTGLINFVCGEQLPFGFGEKKKYIHFQQTYVNPQVKRMPRTSFTREISKYFKEQKKILIDIFSNLEGRISICSDIWSDHWNRNSYMRITAHWIDDNWILQKRIIAFRIFNEHHTAVNISILIREILDEYGLVHKIFSIGFDNASNNTASIRDLQKRCEPEIGGTFFHIRCACHILNLSVQEGLKILSNFVGPIKEAISYLIGHPKIMKEWARFCIAKGRKPKKFVHDVPNRWNSTYDLLNSSLKYKDLLCEFYITRFPGKFDLFPELWDTCKKMVDILQIFKDATCNLSGVYFPTSHLFVAQAFDIISTLRDGIFDITLQNASCHMLNKWLDYYYHIPPIYLVAIVLDPHVKLDGLTQYLIEYYKIIHHLFDLNYVVIDPTIFVHDPLQFVESTKNLINTLYSSYQSQFPNASADRATISSSSRHSTTTSNINARRPPSKQLLHAFKKSKGGTSSTEVDNYLTTSFEFADDDSQEIEGTSGPLAVLEWWSNKSKIYPILSIIAKKILATPASTVAVEQAFSKGGSILDEKRSQLSPDHLEIQTLLADWYDASLREQEIEIKSEADWNDSDRSTIAACSSGTNSDVDDIINDLHLI